MSRPIFWGPNQLILEDGVYVEPSEWRYNELLVIPKVVRFIHDSADVDSETEPGGDNDCLVTIQCTPSDEGDDFAYYIRYDFYCGGDGSVVPAYFCYYQTTGDSCNPDGWSAIETYGEPMASGKICENV